VFYPLPHIMHLAMPSSIIERHARSIHTNTSGYPTPSSNPPTLPTPPTLPYLLVRVPKEYADACFELAPPRLSQLERRRVNLYNNKKNDAS
jgi:hypothetical protein